MGLSGAAIFLPINGKQLSPQTTVSERYKHWISTVDWRRCLNCKNNHGKIWLIEDIPHPQPPIHPKCRCLIETMKAITTGTATLNGTNGADWKLMYEGILPDYYISWEDILALGWKEGKWPSNFAPGKMITHGTYQNRNEHLPQSPGRIWYEADINYKTGKRNTQRVLWSNDGLIFVTYDHYETFYEIISGGSK